MRRNAQKQRRCRWRGEERKCGIKKMKKKGILK
jgi:hypothetical protein